VGFIKFSYIQFLFINNGKGKVFQLSTSFLVSVRRAPR